jgi:tetratricopeptide (TPR) repeat protein
MSKRSLALLLTVLTAAPAAAQEPEPLPPLNVPLHPLTAQERDRREALVRFADAVLLEHEDRLFEALRAYEESLRLDPDAAPVMKALAVLYLGVERFDDAAALSKRVLELDPHDFQVSYLYARQLRSRGKLEEAVAALQVGLQSPRLAERSDLHQQMEYDLGALFERLERPADAAMAFRRCGAVLDHPDLLLDGRLGPDEIQMRAAEVYERVGHNFLDAGKCDEAVEAFRIAQARYPAGAGRLNYHLAHVHLRQGKPADALACLDVYLQGLPQGTEAYELKIDLLHKLKRDGENLGWLEEASAKDRFNVGLKLFLARQYARSGAAAKAEAVYLGLAQQSPSEDLYRDLFRLYRDHYPAGLDAAAALVNTTLANVVKADDPLASNPAPAQAKAMIAALRGDAEVARGVVQAAAKQPAARQYHPEAQRLFAALAGINGLLSEAEYFYRERLKSPLAAGEEAEVYGALLSILWKAGRHEAVIEVCRAGLKATPNANHVLLRADLARALGHQEQWEEALTEIDRAARDATDDEQFTVQHLRVRLLTQAGRTADAEAACQALLKEHDLPGEVLEVRYLLSHVYSRAGKQAEAEAELLACLRIDAGNAAVGNDLAYLYAEANHKLDEAEKLIRAAVEQDRKARQDAPALRPGTAKEFHDNACYIDTLGWVLYRQGRHEEARRELERATALPDGGDPVIWDHLGDTYQALGQPAEAATAWRKALDYYAPGQHRRSDDRCRALREKLKQVEASQ